MENNTNVVFHLEEKTICHKIHLFDVDFFSDFAIEQKTFLISRFRLFVDFPIRNENKANCLGLSFPIRRENIHKYTWVDVLQMLYTKTIIGIEASKIIDANESNKKKKIRRHI